MEQQTPALSDLMAALDRGVNVFEEIGKLYCQVETLKRVNNLAIETIKALAPKPETTPMVPAAEAQRDFHDGDLLIPGAGENGMDKIVRPSTGEAWDVIHLHEAEVADGPSDS